MIVTALIFALLVAAFVACAGNWIAGNSPRSYWWGVLFGVIATVAAANTFVVLLVKP